MERARWYLTVDKECRKKTGMVKYKNNENLGLIDNLLIAKERKNKVKKEFIMKKTEGNWEIEKVERKNIQTTQKNLYVPQYPWL